MSIADNEEKKSDPRIDDSEVSAWDVAAFSEVAGAWQSTNRVKKPTRIQDITISLSSDHQQEESYLLEKRRNSAWPYEDSPCRFFGRSRVKKGLAKMSKEIFDPNFADNLQDSNSTSCSDVDSFCGESGDDSSNASSSSLTLSKRKEKKSPEKAPRSDPKQKPLPSGTQNQHLSASSHGPSYNQMLAWNKKALGKESEHSRDEGDGEDGEEEDGDDDNAETITFTRKASRSSLKREGSQRSLKGESQRNGVRRSSTHRSSSQRSGKSGEDELCSSMHKAAIESRPKSREAPIRRATGGGDMAATVHGTNDVPGYARPSTRRTTRTGPSRAKSGDGLPMAAAGTRRSSRDELGAATLHGKASISRIRTKRRSSMTDATDKSSTSRKSKPDRRSMMKRAMSTTNVKRPEEYGPGAEAAVVSPTRRGGKRPQKPRRNLMDLLREQKPVTEKDLTDKENRQVLHFLMYENKLNISLKELARTVRKETKGGVVPPPPKPELYIEA